MFGKLWIFCSIVACAWSATIPEAVQPEGRIVGGSTAKIESFPWEVSIERKGLRPCAGAIYSDAVIITAAHCVEGLPVSALSVRAGSNLRNSGGFVRQVLRVKAHENYDPATMANDIAVVRLYSALPTSSTVKSVPLAYYVTQTGDDAVVAGWGTMEYGYAQDSNELQSVNVQLISQSQCAGYNYGYGSQITASMICAAAPGKDTCSGDGGSPLVSYGYLVGIASWGQGCALPGFPGVYTSVYYFRSWIQNAGYYI